MRRAAGEALRRLMVRTGDGPLRPLWALAHGLVLRAIARYLAGPTGAAYARGSFATGDVRYGYSDLDVAIVVPDAPGRAGENRLAVRRRWGRVARALPLLSGAVDLAVYERGELAAVVACSTLRARRPLHLAPRAPGDEAGLLVRPGLHTPVADWRPLAGSDLRPEAPDRDDDERHDAAWLELQFVWRWAFGACARPPADLPYLCVKLVADPARIWLWLVHGERAASRREALERALDRLPEEEAALHEALELDSRLARAPDAPLARMLPFLVRMSARLAARMTANAFARGATEVRLLGGETPELALPVGAADQLGGLAGHKPRLLPLADWRARVWPLFPDDAFAVTDLDPGDPVAIGRAGPAAGDLGPFAAMRSDGVLVLPGPGVLRAVQCAVTDPVSLALADGQASARFPDTPGWSAQDSARRAVLEHRAWLGAWRDGATAALTDWMEAQARTMFPAVETLGRLLSAAQAALFVESVEAGQPALPVTVTAAARAFGHDAEERAVVEEAAAAYRASRSDFSDPPARIVAALREIVLARPAYAFDELPAVDP